MQHALSTPVPRSPALVTLETCIGIKSGLCLGRTDGLHRGIVGVFQKEEVLCAASLRASARAPHIHPTFQRRADLGACLHAAGANALRQHAMAHVRSHLVDSPAARHVCLLLPPLAAPYMLWGPEHSASWLEQAHRASHLGAGSDVHGTAPGSGARRACSSRPAL